MLYELIKSVHIIAMVIWFGGTMTAALALLYAMPETITRFVRFDRGVTTPAMVVMWVAGLTMALWHGWFASIWLAVKLVIVIALSGVHGMVSSRLRRVQCGPPKQPDIMRLVLPVMFICISAIVLLVMIKPL